MTGAAVCREPAPGDGIDGVLPDRVVEPDGAADLAHALAEATAAGHATIVRGGGTKLGWGRRPDRPYQILSTSRLLAPLVHRDGDLTATVGAGVRIGDLNTHLAQKGQWLPVESPFQDATIGGVVATNEAGPFRHRFGTPRDLLIGVTLALADGRLVKAGGTVVKNVAGYDLGRLVSGSMGSLAVIVEATFKLAPLAAATATLRLRCDSPAAMAAAAAAVTSSQLEPAAFDLRVACAPDIAPSRELLACFASSPRATATQAQGLAALVSGFAAVSGGAATDAWRDQLTLPWQGGAVVRCAWAPAALADVVAQVEACGSGLAGLVFVGRAAVGAGFVRLDGDPAAQASAVARLRASRAIEHAVVLRADPALKGAIDVWGEAVPWAQPLGALRRALDPAGILGAGRGPL